MQFFTSAKNVQNVSISWIIVFDRFIWVFIFYDNSAMLTLTGQKIKGESPFFIGGAYTRGQKIRDSRSTELNQ